MATVTASSAGGPAIGRGILAPLRPYRRGLTIGIGLLVLTNALEKTVPWLIRSAVDLLRANRARDVLPYAGAIACLAVIGGFVRTGSRAFVFDVGRFVEKDMRMALLRRIHQLGPAFSRRMQTGDIMSRAVNDVGQLRLFYGFGALNIVNSIFAFGLSLTMMLVLSPKLTAWVLAPYPLYIVVTQFFARRIFRHSRAAQEALGKVSDTVQESVAGIRLVRSLSLEDAETRRFERANRESVQRNMDLALVRGLTIPVYGSIGGLGTLIVVLAGGRMVIDHELTLGQFVAFSAFVGQLVWPTLALGFVLSVVQRGRAAFARVREVLDAEPEVQQTENARVSPTDGAIAVRHLTFEHASRKVLDDVSLEVPAGSSLAVLGPVGSGKSTLAALLARILPTPRHSVFLDGQDIVELELRSLRRTIVYAQQDPFLFSTTVARNVAFSLDDPEAPESQEKVRHATEEAQIADEIESLGDGYDTIVGERGVQLSGGQKQRVALARALLVEPRVLVLDDPFSAVDARTEARIIDALERAKQGRTFVLVTNRVAAARRAGRIVVLDAGRVVESGTHDELVERGGLYASIAAKQELERQLEAV